MFLVKKWEKEQGYRLRKELFAWTGNKIAVQVCGSLSPVFDLVSQNEDGERGGLSERLRTIMVTILYSSGMNTTTPRVSGGGVMGWRTGHLPRTGECVNGASSQRFQL